jgi:hypothetical protein
LVDIKQYQYVSLIIFTVLLGTKGAHPVWEEGWRREEKETQKGNKQEVLQVNNSWHWEF